MLQLLFLEGQFSPQSDCLLLMSAYLRHHSLCLFYLIVHWGERRVKLRLGISEAF